MIRMAPAKAHFEPSHPDAEVANVPNRSPFGSLAVRVDTLLIVSLWCVANKDFFGILTFL